MEEPREFVLCFDGTGYKFHGDESDSNVLKIYRMLNRHDARQFHYYQPGFGTYTTSIWQTREAGTSRLKRWYENAKDAAFGTTFDEHVMDGYRFLMRFYCPGDHIYIFGFSRGAYVARLLAEMLDHVGLLEAGNEGKVRYVWGIFFKWAKHSYTLDMDWVEKEKDERFRYMKAFRETFCRPVSQIRFLGLFDTVNSVPRFEVNRNKFMFPYTAKTSARVIRHAVSIDERRAKFRQDLLKDANPNRSVKSKSKRAKNVGEGGDGRTPLQVCPKEVFYRPDPRICPQAVGVKECRGHTEDHVPATGSTTVAGEVSLPEIDGSPSEESGSCLQDIEELWFPGCHADIGGGLELGKDEDIALSHVPLVWMVGEAQRAGLRFAPEKMKLFHCLDDSKRDSGFQSRSEGIDVGQDGEKETGTRSEFQHALSKATTDGLLHDFLRYGKGVPWPTVVSWRMVEYLPFRRMGLQPDGSWKLIRLPLPRGERRDVPREAKIHVSALRRMEADANYRPLNLIQGGKGKRKLAKDQGIGEWKVYAYDGCPVRETYLRRTSETPRLDISS